MMPDDGKQTGTALALPDVAVPAAALARGVEPHQWNALTQTIWKGASPGMVLVALDYCKARRLDPIKRPIHIVKTWDSDANGGKGGWVDAIWEGIGSHRTTASRTNAYAGKDAPEFGPAVTRKLDGANDFTFPEWCRVTVYKIVAGQRVAFTGEVRWLEAYASVKSGAPNRMWRKRTWGQLAKCAEAEALRAAFPDELGDIATAEELDGQHAGPEQARDITPAEDRPAPASRLETLEETFDAETGEIIEPGDVAPAEPEPDRSASIDMIGAASKIETDLMAYENRVDLKAYWASLKPQLDVMKVDAKDLYDDLLRKVNARLKALPA